MLYELFEYLNRTTDLPGMRVGEYISFRSAAAIILSLLIAIFFGKRVIRFLRKRQIGEDIRDLGLEGQLQKKGTPTMGGIIILLAVLVPVLLFGDLGNVYIQLMIISTVWLGFIGGLDDYIKVFRHKKEGLKGRFKIVGQVGLGIIVGTTMWLSDDIVVHEKNFETESYTIVNNETGEEIGSYTQRVVVGTTPEKTTKTSIPFLKDTELDYTVFTGGNELAAWLLYIVVAIFVITAVSNGANLTDGIDGLLTGVSVPIVLVLGILAYLSGHIIYSDYLNIMYIPDSGELICRCIGWILMVQLLPGTDLYGRYGFAYHRWYHRGICSLYPQGVAIAAVVWCLLGRGVVGDNPVGEYLTAHYAIHYSTLFLFVCILAFAHSYIFIAIRSFALLERGFASSSSSVGTITFFISKGEVDLPKKSFSNIPSKLPLFIKFFTMRSSMEWYVITTRRPPGFNRSLALVNISFSASTSWFISMRRAWNIFAISFFSRCGGQNGLAISISSFTRCMGFTVLSFTIFTASLRAQFSSP